MRRNSWQDGVQETNCPILPGRNWTYSFQVKDQIGSFFYFPSLLLHKAAGGYGPIRVNNREVIPIPFPQPHGDIDVLIGDWYSADHRVWFPGIYHIFTYKLLQQLWLCPFFSSRIWGLCLIMGLDFRIPVEFLSMDGVVMKQFLNFNQVNSHIPYYGNYIYLFKNFKIVYYSRLFYLIMLVLII